jgi:hypothetical protein
MNDWERFDRGEQPKWYGVDLDATLAEYTGFKGPGLIGAPVPVMVARVKRWLEEGKDVRIFTARVGPSCGMEHYPELERKAIEAWCLLHIGRVLPITATKDFLMEELWDDRAVGVVKNTGLRADGAPEPGYEPGDLTEVLR